MCSGDRLAPVGCTCDGGDWAARLGALLAAGSVCRRSSRVAHARLAHLWERGDGAVSLGAVLGCDGLFCGDSVGFILLRL